MATGSCCRSLPCTLSAKPAPRPLVLLQSTVKLHLSARSVGLSVRCSSSGSISSSSAVELSATQSADADYVPKAEFYKVEAIVRPWRLSHVTAALLKAGIRGATVTDVRGLGAQGGALERHAGSEFSESSFVAKVKMEIVICADQVESVIETIIDEARTGEIGDGKIFVIPVADIIRVRTGERGLPAERMVGGRADLLSAAK